MVWNAVVQIGAGIISKIGGSSSARAAASQQFNYNMALQKQAQEWNEYMYKNRYSMQVEDLKRAGINPLYGLGNASSPSIGASTVGMADYVSEQNNKFNQMMSVVDFAQNLSAKKAQTKLIERQAQTEEQNTLLRTAEVLEKQINNKYLPEQRRNELKKMQAETLESLAKTNESYANKSLKEAQTAREQLEMQPSKRYERWAKENPEKARILESLTVKAKNLETGNAIAKKGLSALRFLITK